jgi:hypothetical protein
LNGTSRRSDERDPESSRIAVDAAGRGRRVDAVETPWIALQGLETPWV